MTLFDADGQELVGVPKHGDHAWDTEDNEYMFSDREGEGWMPREDFERKYAGGPYPLG
jgi:hypothetical protein